MVFISNGKNSNSGASGIGGLHLIPEKQKARALRDKISHPSLLPPSSDFGETAKRAME
jgi:hypothetical protein